MTRKLIIAAVALVLLAGGATIAWSLLDMPPVRLVLKYGYPSPMGPTGRTLTVEGVEFVEISAGYFRMGSHLLCEKGDLLGRVSALVGLEWGTHPKHDSDECPPHWVEYPNGYWIKRHGVTLGEYHALLGSGDKVQPHAATPNLRASVAWSQARDYCNKLSARSGLPIRLPSEAECLSAAQCSKPAEATTRPVRNMCADLPTGPPRGLDPSVEPCGENAWGILGLAGEFREWCADDWHPNYSGSPSDGNPGTGKQGIEKVALSDSACLILFWPGMFEGQEFPREVPPRAPKRVALPCGFRAAFTITTDTDREALERHLDHEGGE